MSFLHALKMLFRCEKSLCTLLFTFCEAESDDHRMTASGEVALTSHLKLQNVYLGYKTTAVS